MEQFYYLFFQKPCLANSTKSKALSRAWGEWLVSKGNTDRKNLSCHEVMSGTSQWTPQWGQSEQGAKEQPGNALKSRFSLKNVMHAYQCTN